MEELALNQETERHAVDGHGVDITTNEKANHEVRPENTHDTSEEPPLIKGDVVEQGRLPANGVAGFGFFIQEAPVM